MGSEDSKRYSRAGLKNRFLKGHTVNILASPSIKSLLS